MAALLLSAAGVMDESGAVEHGRHDDYRSAGVTCAESGRLATGRSMSKEAGTTKAFASLRYTALTKTSTKGTYRRAGYVRHTTFNNHDLIHPQLLSGVPSQQYHRYQ